VTDIRKKKDLIWEAPTWEEESGLLAFLRSIPAEVEKFNRALGFDLRLEAGQPTDIDGHEGLVPRVGFVITRQNRLYPERTFCVCSVLTDGVLDGYTGILSPEGGIRTIRALRPLNDFHAGGQVLYDWFRDLVKTSCDK
jgi:hypothetical protein